MPYKFIEDLTSDVMFEASGTSLKELFVHSAKALFSVICTSGVKPKKTITVEVNGENLKELMFNWLQELIALVDIEEMFFSDFEIIEIDEKHLTARCLGEPVSQEKSGTVVKSVTNYKYSVEKTKEGYKARICLDI